MCLNIFLYKCALSKEWNFVDLKYIKKIISTKFYEKINPFNSQTRFY